MDSTREWKNMLTCAGKNIYAFYEDKSMGEMTIATIIPDIENVKVINQDKSTVVIICFKDGTSEKAILAEGDVYSLEQGISICLEKKLLSNLAPNHGSSIYNKLIKRAFKVYNKKKEEAEKALEEAEREAKRKANRKAKILKKRNRRKQREEEKEIRTRKEAYVRALAEISNNADAAQKNLCF